MGIWGIIKIVSTLLMDFVLYYSVLGVVPAAIVTGETFFMHGLVNILLFSVTGQFRWSS